LEFTEVLSNENIKQDGVISLLLCSSLCFFACGKLDPPASKYKTALIMAVSASPVIQVFFRTDYKDMESAADGKYDHKAVPVVDGGVAYIWKLRSAPDKTWYQVKHQGETSLKFRYKLVSLINKLFLW